MNFSTIGSAQAIPPAPGVSGASGLVNMSGSWTNQVGQRLLTLGVGCLPESYVSYSGEVVILAFNTGLASGSGIPILGALSYLPLVPTVSQLNLGGVICCPPGDTIPPTSYILAPMPCPFGSGTPGSYGRSISVVLSPGLSGATLSAQFFIVDVGLGVAYSSNAINMVVP